MTSPRKYAHHHENLKFTRICHFAKVMANVRISFFIYRGWDDEAIVDVCGRGGGDLPRRL